MASRGEDNETFVVETTDENDEALITDIGSKLLRVVQGSAAKTDPSVDVGHVAASFERAMHTAAQESVVRAKTFGKRYAERSLQGGEPPGGDAGQKALETEERLGFYFNERMKAELPCAPSPPLESQDTPDDVHRRALDECQDQLVRKMRVKGTGLLDRLVSEEVLSVCRADSIRGLKTSDLNRSVLKHVRALSRERFDEVFIPALKEETGNALLAQQLESTMTQIIEQTRSENESECKICPMRSLIDLRHIADLLLPLIGYDVYEDITSGKLENTVAWRRVLEKVHHTQKIGPALQMKYPDVWKEMGDKHITTLECKCLEFGFCSPRQRSTNQSTEISSKEKIAADAMAVDTQKSQSVDEENPDFSLVNNVVDGEGLQSVGSTHGSSGQYLTALND